jgi:hypothetical protein
MPVDRSYIMQFAYDPAQVNLFQALSSLANFSDGLEQAAGVTVGASSTSTQAQTPAPAQATWTIAAANGHYMISITNPTVSGQTTQPLIQHTVRSALDQNFNANSSMNTYSLGFGQISIDVIDPNETRYWQIQSRYPGSNWNNWLTYSTSAGVVALNAGNLVTT